MVSNYEKTVADNIGDDTYRRYDPAHEVPGVVPLLPHLRGYPPELHSKVARGAAGDKLVEKNSLFGRRQKPFL